MKKEYKKFEKEADKFEIKEPIKMNKKKRKIE